jgi:DNA-binding transcriptional LysR family regulator
MIQRACARSGFVPRIVARATDFGVLLSLVAAGAGVTLVPALATRGEALAAPGEALAAPGEAPAAGGEATLSASTGARLLWPAEPVTRQIFAVSRRGGDRQPAVRVVLDALAAAATSIDLAAPRDAASRLSSVSPAQ